MASWRIQNCLYRHGDKEIPLISGEFHYWRVLRENWLPIARRIKAMGLEVVASYIPWNYHELEPGRYDFTGETSPQRDLKGFVELLRDEGLWLIIRPGPYIYSEWPFGGVPERAARHHRLAPEFLEMARDYIAHVCEVLVPYQVTRGGNILLFQADNEPYPPLDSFGTEMGGFEAPGVFKDWLKERYGGEIGRLNRAWRTDYADFGRACVHFHEAYVNTELRMADRLLPGEAYHARYADTHAFIGWYAARIVETVAGWLREAGVEVPVYANGWSPLFQDFNRFMEVADLAGTDIYPPAFFEGDRPVRDNWFYNIDILKLQEAEAGRGNVWCAEFQCGIYPIRIAGYLPPGHFEYVALSLMARGLKGWNWYMLVNRDNWYNCPINEWGRTNEYYPEHERIVATARRVEPWHTRELADAALLCYKPHRVIQPGNFEAAYRALEAGDIAFHYYDPQSANPPAAGVMVYAGGDWLDRASAGRLADWVEGGGTLICFNRFPERDENGACLERLPLRAPDGARPTGLPVSIRYGDGRARIVRAGHQDRKVNFCYFHEAPGEPVRLALSTEAREELVDVGAAAERSFIMGYAVSAGRGRVVHLGCNPSAEVLDLVLEREGKTPHVRAADDGVLTTVHRHRDGHLVLFVINRTAQPRRAAVALNGARLGLNGREAVTDLVTGEAVAAADGLRAGRLIVPLDAHGVAVRRIG
ncbi:MAG: beta-galactosidase [Lentisphaerae bacterium]|nr:beta-galactosidase [Lentisphaerota bacterium]